jgi:hypothetical protein
VTVRIDGVLDIQDNASLDKLARKLRPVFENLSRRA